MRFAALLLLAALAGALVCAREYGPPTAPTKALTVQGSFGSCLYSSLSLLMLCWPLFLLQMTPVPPPLILHMWPIYLTAGWEREQAGEPLTISSHTLLYPL